MAFRGNESPMDFEWQGYGPVDATSPFHRQAMEGQHKKRTHNEFNSPKKTTLTSLQDSNNQTSLFSAVPTSPPELPSYRAPSFTTPRKPFDIDFSSGPENSSPADQADNEETPDVKSLPFEFTSASTKPANKRNSLFGIYGQFAPSAGRGGIRKPNSDAIAKRIHKKRRRAQNFDNQLVLGRRSSEESSDEDNAPNSKSKSESIPHEVGWITGLFTFIHKYPDAPSIIAKYLQVFFNAAILGGCLYMLYSFYATIRADVDRASEEAMAEVLAEMAACSKNYVENRCGADTRLPALESVCQNWELCMNRDASAVKRARLSAHTFAEIFNSFVEPISLKTMIFTITLVVVGLLINNATFTLYRRQQEHHYMDNYRQASGPFMHPGQHPGQIGHFPPTPAVPYSQTHVGWHENQGLHDQHRLEYSRSPSKELRARSRSPEKRSNFNG